MIAERLARWSRERPDRVALQIKRGERYLRITYAELLARARGAARALRADGVMPGARVALLADNGPEWAVAYLGIHLAGAVVVPLDVQYGPKEVGRLLSFAEACGIILDEAHRPAVAELDADQRQALRIWYLAPQDADAPAPRDSDADDTLPLPAPDSPMSIIFTSGTTGTPKGVQLLQRNIGSNIEGVLAAIDVRPEDNVLNVLPLHHAYASTVGLFVPLAAGGTVTFCASLRGPDLLAAMRETGVTIFPGVPQLFALLERGIFQQVEHRGTLARFAFHRLFRLSGAVRRATGLRPGRLLFRAVHGRFGGRVRLLASGGAKLDPDVARRLLDLGFLVLEGYGLTETSPVISFTRPDNPRPGSVGLPLEGVEVRIHEPNASGEGEVCVRGPNVMAGYYKQPEATAEVLRDGWFYTGDLGRLDADGLLSITGRAKDVIVLPSGKNIYPEEVEARYQEALFVKELCILQAAAEDGSPKGLCAAVVPDVEALAARQVAGTGERIRFELRRVGAQLPSYMAVTDLVLLEGPLPRTRLGKLKRHEIEEQVRRQRRGETEGPDLEPSPETTAMLAHPDARRFLARLGEVLDREEPIRPGMDLQLDLGIDSLTLVQLFSVLEQEFGVKIPDEEVAAVRTVEDLLERVIAAEGTGGETVSLAWSERLSRPADPPLAARFNLDRGPLADAAVWCARAVLRALVQVFFRPRLRGLEHLPRDGALLICPTHQSYIDAVLIYTLFPWRLVRHTLFLAFGEIFARPPLAWVTGVGRVVLTGGASTLAESLSLSAEGLDRGMAVCVFPEGALTLDGEIAPPRPGAGILASERRVPLVPVLIDGSVGCLSRLQGKFRPAKVHITVGEPIPPPATDRPTQDDYKAMVQQWYETVTRLRGERKRPEIQAAIEEEASTR